MKGEPAVETGVADEASNSVLARANLALTLVQPVAGQLAELTGWGQTMKERSHRSSGPVTPPDGAFAIWGPIFLATLALALRDIRDARGARGGDGGPHGAGSEAAAPHRVSGTGSRSRLLAGLAYAGNTAWSLQSQFGGLGWSSVAIIMSTTTAASAAMLEAEHEGARQGAGVAALATGALAGWLTVAAFANLEATLNETRGRPRKAAETRRSVALVGGASSTAGALALASHGNLAYAAAACWGLGGVVVRNVRKRNTPVAAAAAAGVIALLGATLLGRRRSR